MKTFRQWYDELSEEAKELIKGSYWLDPSNPDCYPKSKFTTVEITSAILTVNEWLFTPAKQKLLDWLYSVLVASFAKTEAEKESAFNKIVETSSDEIIKSDYINYLPRELRSKVIFACYDNRLTASFITRLYFGIGELMITTEDFDNIKWDMLELNYGASYSARVLRAICPEDIYYKLCLKQPLAFRLKNSVEKDNIFNDLFFKDDGWTEEQKLYYLRMDGWFTSDTKFLRRYMNELVEKDKYYLLYATEILIRDRRVALRLYRENEYPEDYIKWFLIVKCCISRKVPKTMANRIGENSALLKLYNYDINKLFNELFVYNQKYNIIERK